MKNKLSGYVEKTILGKKVGFKFGTNAFYEFCDMKNCELEDIDKHLLLPKKNPKNKKEAPRINERAMVDLIYCAAKAHCLSSEKEITFNRYVVADWIDDMEQDDFNDIVEALNNSKVMGKKIIEADAEKKV